MIWAFVSSQTPLVVLESTRSCDVFVQALLSLQPRVVDLGIKASCSAGLGRCFLVLFV
jgi:hypothetical protein